MIKGQLNKVQTRKIIELQADCVRIVVFDTKKYDKSTKEYNKE